jgi:hypothetical protein
MKNIENMNARDDMEMAKVAGGVPHTGHHYDPPAAPQEPAEPKPEPGPMGQQVSPGEEFNTLIDFLNSRN